MEVKKLYGELLFIQILNALWDAHDHKPLLGSRSNPTQASTEACLYSKKEPFSQSNLAVEIWQNA